MATTFRILDFRPLRRNSLIGFAKVELPSGIIIHDCTILICEHGAWASPPSKPQIDRDGNAIKDPSGKIKYSPIIEFSGRQVRDRWSNAIIEALRLSFPGALDVEDL
jgi:hypothetical protein